MFHACRPEPERRVLLVGRGRAVRGGRVAGAAAAVQVLLRVRAQRVRAAGRVHALPGGVLLQQGVQAARLERAPQGRVRPRRAARVQGARAPSACPECSAPSMLLVRSRRPARRPAMARAARARRRPRSPTRTTSAPRACAAWPSGSPRRAPPTRALEVSFIHNYLLFGALYIHKYEPIRFTNLYTRIRLYYKEISNISMYECKSISLFATAG